MNSIGREALWKPPQLWKSANNADSHKLFGKASPTTLGFSTVSTAPTAVLLFRIKFIFRFPVP
jgi:hypothetical protein